AGRGAGRGWGILPVESHALGRSRADRPREPDADHAQRRDPERQGPAGKSARHGRSGLARGAVSRWPGTAHGALDALALLDLESLHRPPPRPDGGDRSARRPPAASTRRAPTLPDLEGRTTESW